MFSFGKKWFNRHSLTFRLGVSILTSVSVGVIGLLFLSYQYFLPLLREQIDELANFKLQNEIKNISSMVEETQDTALTIKNTLKELKTTDIQLFQHLLNSALQTINYEQAYSPHAWIYVFPNGDVTKGRLYSGKMDNGNFVFEKRKVSNFYQLYPWFKEVPQREEFFWSEPYIDEELKNRPWVTTNLLPFKFSGSTNYNGLIAVSVDLQALKDEVAAQDVKGAGQSLLISRDGLYVIHPREEIELKQTIYDVAKLYGIPELNEVGLQLQNSRSGNVKISSSSVYGKPVIFFYAMIPDLNWGMCIVFLQENFFKPLKDFYMQSAQIMLLFLLILFVIISFICRRSTQPLLNLSQIALQYGNGDFSAELPERKSSDEIGIMTTAFHNMRDNLLEHIEMVKAAAADMQKNESELTIARNIQKSVLPVDFPAHPVFEVCASMESSLKVGGDFYDFFFINKDKFAVVVADVSGKGIPAALYMMTAKTLIKNTVKSGKNIADAFASVNNDLCNGNQTNMFVTAFLAVLNLKTGVLEYVNAGHNPPFYYDNNGYHLMPVTRNIVLGGMENMLYKAESLQMKAGERLFLYTDGVTEAENKNHQFYGENRLEKVLSQDLQSPHHTLVSIRNDIADFALGAKQSDDITMLELLYIGDEDYLLATKAEIASIDTVLKKVSADMKSKKIPANVQSKVMVACEEIISNIVQYAYLDGGMLRLRSSVENGSYILRFIDNGRAYNLLEHDNPEVDGSAESRNIGGLGIFLVRQMMDDVSYERTNNRNIVTVSVHIS